MERIGCRVAFALISTSSVLLAQDPPPQPGAVPPPSTQPATPPTEQAPAQAPPAKGFQWEVGDYKLKFGGYIKVDLIHDFDTIGSKDSFDPRTIPTNDEANDGVNTRMHAKQTRLWLDAQGPTSAGPLRLYVEGDFFGDDTNAKSFRMRHAYGRLGSILGGQTWSTFMDEDAMPETLDFESPIAFPLIRQAQMRYIHEYENGNVAAVALEDPASAMITPGPGDVEEATPDLTARYRLKTEFGHAQVGLFLGTARFDPAVGSADTVPLWGLNLSAKVATTGKDNAYFQGTYGDGVGRYRGGITAAPDAGGDLEAVTVTAAMLGYEHHWSDELRSTLSYSWGEGDVPGGAPVTTTEVLEYLAANLIWQTSDRSWFGVEWLYGAREAVDNSRGEANRLQAALRFDF